MAVKTLPNGDVTFEFVYEFSDKFLAWLEARRPGIYAACREKGTLKAVCRACLTKDGNMGRYLLWFPDHAHTDSNEFDRHRDTGCATMILEVHPEKLAVEGTMPSPADWSTAALEYIVTNDALIAACRQAGLNDVEIIRRLAKRHVGMMDAIMQLLTIAPRKIKLPDGSIVIYRCPDHLVPEE